MQVCQENKNLLKYKVGREIYKSFVICGMSTISISSEYKRTVKGDNINTKDKTRSLAGYMAAWLHTNTATVSSTKSCVFPHCKFEFITRGVVRKVWRSPFQELHGFQLCIYESLSTGYGAQDSLQVSPIEKEHQLLFLKVHGSKMQATLLEKLIFVGFLVLFFFLFFFSGPRLNVTN